MRTPEVIRRNPVETVILTVGTLGIVSPMVDALNQAQQYSMSRIEQRPYPRDLYEQHITNDGILSTVALSITSIAWIICRARRRFLAWRTENQLKT